MPDKEYIVRHFRERKALGFYEESKYALVFLIDESIGYHLGKKQWKHFEGTKRNSGMGNISKK